MENNIISRPEWNKSIKGRALVWYRRHCSAWDMAALVCGDAVTEDEYNAAAALLDSIQRYALASVAELERESNSERYCNSAYHARRERLLDARRERLEGRLKRYGLRLFTPWIYPAVVNERGYDQNFLHYFD